MKRTLILISVVAFIGATAGCYKTQIGSLQTAATGPTHEARQWFTAAGLVNLSGAAGKECAGQGVAYASSRVSGWDILIDIGIGVAAGLVGTMACDSIDDREEYASCVSGFTAAGPLLLSARTVAYRCNATGATGKLPLLPNMSSATDTTASSH